MDSKLKRSISKTFIDHAEHLFWGLWVWPDKWAGQGGGRGGGGGGGGGGGVACIGDIDIYIVYRIYMKFRHF